MGISSYGVRLQKLRAASPEELGSRLRYRAYLAYERRRWQAGAFASPSRLHEALRRDLRQGDWRTRLLEARSSSGPRWFPSIDLGDRMRAVLDADYAAETAGTLREAAAVRRGEFSFFGLTFRFEGDVPWQQDPVTGREWPASYHADVPIHGGDVGFGDVKHVWELNRHQFLIDLAKAAWLTGADDSLLALQRIVRSWLQSNPYGLGVNWSCALEPAFRTWSWLWAYSLTRTRLSSEFHLEWLTGFYDHGRFLSRHLEHHSSPYNHLIGEAAALYALGVSFPEFKEAAAWRREGLAVLHERLEEQFYTDGGSVEQSTFYHHATTGFYILVYLLARANGVELPTSIRDAIERALEFSMLLSQPDGTTPSIGGADDGKPIRMEHLEFWNFRPYLAVGAVMYRRGDFKAVAGRFHEDALWLLGPDGLSAFQALEPVAPPSRAALLASSGYAVSRSEWSPAADYVCVDVGEQAAGMRPDAVPNSMHGHADCLSVVVWLGGAPVLVDSGFYAYNCGGEWESYFRETAAHNTARVDGRDQARHIGKMAWSHSYRVTVDDWWTDERQAWVVGSHDGYARGKHPVRHRRAVWRRPGSYVVIHDEFVGHGAHDIEVNFHFAPGGLRHGAGSTAQFGEVADVAWVGNIEWTAETAAGGTGPHDGWICTSLGVRQPAPRLTLRGRMQGTAVTLLTVLAGRAIRPERLWAGRAGDQAIVAVAHADAIDWVTAAGLGANGPIRTDARVAVCTTADGKAAEHALLQGTFVELDLGRLPAGINRMRETRLP